MSSSPLISVIRGRLHCAGYRDFSMPIKMAGIEFSFTGALHGCEGRALDLVLLVDTTTGDFGDRDGVRVRQRMEAFSRALDISGSRYVVTTILVGAVLAEEVNILSETCRVLHVEDISLSDDKELKDEAALLQLEDRIRVLLPLTLPSRVAETQDSSDSAIEQLVRALPKSTNSVLLEAVVEASNLDDQAVTEAVASIMNNAFPSEIGGIHK